MIAGRCCGRATSASVALFGVLDGVLASAFARLSGTERARALFGGVAAYLLGLVIIWLDIVIPASASIRRQRHGEGGAGRYCRPSPDVLARCASWSWTRWKIWQVRRSPRAARQHEYCLKFLHHGGRRYSGDRCSRAGIPWPADSVTVRQGHSRSTSRWTCPVPFWKNPAAPGGADPVHLGGGLAEIVPLIELGIQAGRMCRGGRWVLVGQAVCGRSGAFGRAATSIRCTLSAHAHMAPPPGMPCEATIGLVRALPCPASATGSWEWRCARRPRCSVYKRFELCRR